MSALGQKQTFAPQKVMSALPPKADMCGALGMSALCQLRTCIARLSITSSARASGIGGISRDRASLRRFDPYFFARSITKHVATIDPLGLRPLWL